ncbi:MAG: hypothetical protein WBD22_12105 [Pyrinomonadaceae bacterium]
MIDGLVFIVAFLILFTKFLDCHSTALRITAIDHERNNFARTLMRKLGILQTIWAIFVLVVFVVTVSLILLFYVYETNVFKIVFIMTGMFVALVQSAIAYANYIRRPNFITRVASGLYRRL